MNSEEFEIPEETKETPNANLREELLSLSEKGEIKQTEKYIRKASQDTLVKIKKGYERKQLDAANEFISENLISKFSDLKKNLELVDDSEEMEKELADNQMLKKDIKNLVGYMTPFLPYIGLFCGGVVIAKHVINKKYNVRQEDHLRFIKYMGCKPSRLQVQPNGDLFNEDTDIKRIFLTGIHISKGAEGIEGNIQIALGTTRKKKYERVADNQQQALSPSSNEGTT